MKNLLHRILETKKDDIQRARTARPLKELQRRIRDIEKPLAFRPALTSKGFGIIAEIKKKSPSRSDMRPENVEEAPEVYRENDWVKAVSILTDWTYFGMTVEEMERLKPQIKKPILRKDFIFDEYQIWEARAFGADAILLMACIPVSKRQLKVLFDLASELGIEVLFEVHSQKELRRVPDKARIIGINSRKFMTSQQDWRYFLSRWSSRLSRIVGIRDLSTDIELFHKLIGVLPKGVIKVAESGVTPSSIAGIRNLNFDCALIGTALLQSPGGVRNALNQFVKALEVAEDVLQAPAAVHV